MAPPAPPPAPEPRSTTPPSASPASGGFTQLFGSLSSAESVRSAPPTPPSGRVPLAQENEPFFPREGPAANRQRTVDTAPLQAGPGEFTRLMQTLSAEPEPTAPPPAPAERVAPPPSGPGEFTRVISQSALRDAAPASGSAGGPAAAPPSRPAAGPPLPPAPSSFPPLPHPPSLAGMPHFPMAPPPSPPPPAVAAPAPGKLHKYLPLLLVCNAFLLLLVILAVIFLLTRK
jgi:hypothetical protein